MDRGRWLGDAGRQLIVGTLLDISSRKEMEQQLLSMAITDPLTGLSNRRAFNERLQLEWERLKRSPEIQAALVLCDIDHFKRINDEHGHPIGDRALCHFARLAEDELRGSTDIVGRWGGEEFLLLLPETRPEQAHACVDRLRRRLMRHPLPGVSPVLVMSFSAGIGECRGAEDLDAVIERADQAMYRAKQAGRGRTELG